MDVGVRATQGAVAERARERVEKLGQLETSFLTPHPKLLPLKGRREKQDIKAVGWAKRSVPDKQHLLGTAMRPFPIQRSTMSGKNEVAGAPCRCDEQGNCSAFFAPLRLIVFV
jgi:hypothetical protein